MQTVLSFGLQKNKSRLSQNRFIAGAIAQLTDNTYRHQLLYVEKVTPMRQWSARQADKLKKSDYRQGYLVQRKN